MKLILSPAVSVLMIALALLARTLRDAKEFEQKRDVLTAILAGIVAASALRRAVLNFMHSPPQNIKLTYFDIKGAAEKIRLTLAVGSIPFEDKRIKFQDWTLLKPNTPHGVLPTFEFGGKTIDQSTCLMKLAARWGGGRLYPVENLELFTRIERMLGLIDDLHRAFYPAHYFLMGDVHRKFGHPADMTNDAKKGIAKLLRTNFLQEDLPKFMGFFVDAIKETGGPFLCGPLSIADMTLLPWLESMSSGTIDFVPNDCLSHFPEILEYIIRVRSVPSVSAYHTGSGGSD